MNNVTTQTEQKEQTHAAALPAYATKLRQRAKTHELAGGALNSRSANVFHFRHSVIAFALCWPHEKRFKLD